ncbi:hypothetical protein TUM17577_25000 [Enterobacter asburiae]|nr:hypothetical protein TUM17577_25000 [Enterobacter asburiae]
MFLKKVRATDRGDCFTQDSLRADVGIIAQAIANCGIDLTIVKIHVNVSNIELNIELRIPLPEAAETRGQPLTGE